MHRIDFWHCLPVCGRQNRLTVVYLSSLLLLSFVCLMLLPSDVQAQNRRSTIQGNLLKHDKKLIHFGIALGFNRSRFQITHSDAFTFHDTIKVVESSWSPGFNVGIVSDLHLNENIHLRFIPTLIFTEKDLEYTEIEGTSEVFRTATIESIILGFPLYLKFKSDRIFNNYRFYAIAGARIDWDLASNSEARKRFDIVKLNRFDFVAEYGVGLEFYFPLFIFAPEIRFTHGLGNIHTPTPGLRDSNVLNKLRSRGFFMVFQFEG